MASIILRVTENLRNLRTGRNAVSEWTGQDGPKVVETGGESRKVTCYARKQRKVVGL